MLNLKMELYTTKTCKDLFTGALFYTKIIIESLKTLLFELNSNGKIHPHQTIHTFSKLS